MNYNRIVANAIRDMVYCDDCSKQQTCDSKTSIACSDGIKKEDDQ